MKLQNPFDRLKKKDFVPMSLFPANKVTRTSMPIGRLVPLYTIPMYANNRLKVSVSQLTRFLTMSAPVMQNFEITYGAFFCPYLALDDFFVDSSARGFQFDNTFTRQIRDCALHANEFFDMSTAEQERVHPILKNPQFLSPSALKAGSLFDHLQYKCWTDIDKSEIYSMDSGASRIIVSEWPLMESAHLLGLTPVDETTEAYWPDRSSGHVMFNTRFENPQGGRFDVPLILRFITNSPYFGDDTQEYDAAKHAITEIYESHANSSTAYSDAVSDGDIPTREDAVIGAAAVQIWNDYVKDYDAAHRKYFAGMTVSQAWSRIIDDYAAEYVSKTHSDFYANATRWLVYQRIYSDYFLPVDFVDCERYRAMIGSGYAYSASSNNATLDLAFSENPYTNKWMTWNSADPAIWYAPYLRAGECMPVLWDMNQFTALKPKDDRGDPTAIGSSVEQNFYQRQVARFKALARRMGFDVQSNLKTVYGDGPNDETLRKSQVIGFKKFDVSIGDVAKTSDDGVDKNLGDFAGYAVSRDEMSAFDWTAKQNGMVMILAYIRPKYTAIINSVPRDILKEKYMDYLLPTFGGVTYQDVTYRQFNPTGIASHDDKVFGKQEIYAEYMSLDNECSGRMATDCRHYNMDRSVDPYVGSLTNPQNLGFLYMTEADDLNRCFVDKENDPCLVSAFFQGNVTRQLPDTIRMEY